MCVQEATRRALESQLRRLTRQRNMIRTDLREEESKLARWREEANECDEQIDQIRKDLEEADRADEAAKQGLTMVTYE